MAELTNAELEVILVDAPPKLRTLAAWLEKQQAEGRLPGDPADHEVTEDLREWADLLDRLMDFFDGVGQQLEELGI